MISAHSDSRLGPGLHLPENLAADGRCASYAEYPPRLLDFCYARCLHGAVPVGTVFPLMQRHATGRAGFSVLDLLRAVCTLPETGIAASSGDHCQDLEPFVLPRRYKRNPRG